MEGEINMHRELCEIQQGVWKMLKRKNLQEVLLRRIKKEVNKCFGSRISAKGQKRP